MSANNKKTSDLGINKKYIAVFLAVIAFILVVCILFLSAKKSRSENKETQNGTSETIYTETTGNTPSDTAKPESEENTVDIGVETASPDSSSSSETEKPPETTVKLPESTTTPVTSKPPVQTTVPVTTPPPTPIQRPDNIVNPLPTNDKVDDSYFSDALFIGDSRTHGMALYGGVKSTYYYATSLSAQAALTKAFVKENGADVTLIEALKKHPEFKKIYVSFGVNEHWMNANTFKGHYEKLIDEIMKVCPHAEIYIQALIPVSPPSTVSQANLDVFNQKLLEIANAKKIYFIDVSEPFVLADGTKGLTKDISTDGVHLNTKGVKMLFDYIRTHTAK